MKKCCILGAGTAGTMMANHLYRALDKKEWSVTVVDQDRNHYYQPGFLFIPFGVYQPFEVVRPKRAFLPGAVQYVQERVQQIDHARNQLLLESGTKLAYDLLVIATGARIVPSMVQGLPGDEWQKSVFDFYTIEGSTALARALDGWKGGKLVVHLAEMPIKCPVAPLEFAFLADWFFTRRGVRDNVEITYVTPLSGAFTKPVASKVLGSLLERKGIRLVADFAIEKVDAAGRTIVSYDEKTVDYDLLVTVPTNMGDPVMERSGLGDELNFVATDKHTLQSKKLPNVFVIGDATDLPSSKAGSVAHFQAEILTQNIRSWARGKELTGRFDGHSNCFVETGFGKAILIDFNYEVEPVTGTFPFAGIGPLRLLKESPVNHLGKLAFKWIYWNLLLPGLPMPGIPAHMSRAGKDIPNAH